MKEEFAEEKIKLGESMKALHGQLMECQRELEQTKSEMYSFMEAQSDHHSVEHHSSPVSVECAPSSNKKPRTASHEPRTPSHESRSTTHEQRNQSHESRTPSHESRSTTHESRTPSHEPRSQPPPQPPLSPTRNDFIGWQKLSGVGGVVFCNGSWRKGTSGCWMMLGGLLPCSQKVTKFRSTYQFKSLSNIKTK